MHLIIDVGNSFVKLAVFDDGALQYKTISEKNILEQSIEMLLSEYTKITHAIVSSVGRISDLAISALKKKLSVVELTHAAKLPFQNDYATPKTLGVDRIALVSAAAAQFQNKNVLIIDAGSCITYDLLTSENHYKGGAISPGISMRYKAMHAFTANLPTLEKELPKNSIGNSTKSSMHIGVIQGVVHEIDGFIREYNEKFTNLTVILTGGDAHFLRDSIKNDIFANSNFLLEGLNHILEINKD